MQVSIDVNYIISNKQCVSGDHITDFVELLEQGKQLPPITVRRGAGFYVLVDGRHRLAAHRIMNIKYIKANITL